MTRIDLLAVAAAVVAVSVATAQPAAAPSAAEKAYKAVAEMRDVLDGKRPDLLKEREQYLNARAKAIMARKNAKSVATRQKNARPDPIDYSRFDRCPEGNPWEKCSHGEEKQAWLNEQLATREQKFARAMEKIFEDKARADDELNKSLASLTNLGRGYEKNRTAFEEDTTKMRKELQQVKRVVFDESLKTSLGWLSKQEEVGPKGGADTVSTGKMANGKDDPGGVSYGLYQMTSQTTNKKTNEVAVGGTVQDFVTKNLPAQFAGLTPGTPEFAAKWRELAEEDYKTFGEKQHGYIKSTHYDPLATRLKDDVGLDVAARSKVLQNAMWSTAVNHNPLRANEWLEPVLKDHATMTDRQLLEAIYDARTKHYPALKDRYTRELQTALDALAREQPAPKP